MTPFQVPLVSDKEFKLWCGDESLLRMAPQEPQDALEDDEWFFPSMATNQRTEKDKKNAKEASGIAAAVTKHTAGKFS